MIQCLNNGDCQSNAIRNPDKQYNWDRKFYRDQDRREDLYSDPHRKVCLVASSWRIHIPRFRMRYPLLRVELKYPIECIMDKGMP